MSKKNKQFKVPKKEIFEGSGIKNVVILGGDVKIRFEATMSEKDWEKTREENPDWSEEMLYNYMHGKAAAIYLMAIADMTENNKIKELWNDYCGQRMHFSIKEET